MKTKTPKRFCQCGCGKQYTPGKAWQKYASLRCKNRAAAARLREKARRNGYMKEEARG